MKNVFRPILVLFLLLNIYSVLDGQEEYRVYFSDKANTTFDPYAYFDAKSIARRIKSGLPLSDSTDFPVNQYYVKEVMTMAEDYLGESRWMNVLFCIIADDQVDEISRLPFVKEVEWVDGSTTFAAAGSINEESMEDHDYVDQVLLGQTAVHEPEFFDEQNLSGKGVRIAILDVGFKGANTSSALQHVFDQNKLIATRDFIRNREVTFEKGSTHGCYVLHCIAGKQGDQRVGLATEAEILLARTERNVTEFKSEEKNWLLAAEWADKNGADIINSSLGYTNRRYYQTDMDGKTAFVSKAASIAARKGILVVNSAGNEGDMYWKCIGAPADVDSVLTVGGISSATGYHSDWSSYGPTADNRMKPNVCSYGNVVIPDGSAYSPVETQGTSFSSPLIAGFAACVLELHPEWNNMELFAEIEKSGHLYPYFDYAHGHGIPRASYFTHSEPLLIDTTFDVHLSSDMLYVKVREPYRNEANETDSLDVNTFTELSDAYLYYHIENEEGRLDNYVVNSVYSEDGASIYIGNLTHKKVRIYYRGHYHEQYIE